MKYTPQDQFKAACDAAELTINGPEAHDPQIDDARKFYSALAHNPLLALGECYAAEHYDVEDLSWMLQAFIKAEMNGDIQKLFTLEQKFRLAAHYMWWRFNFNRFNWWQSRIANDHYNLDNPLFLSMFGEKHKKYTSALYYPQYGEFDLDLFQELDLYIAWLRMGLKEGDTVCDWGFWFWTNTKFFVENFWVHVTGITISEEQYKYAQEVCRDISDKVTLVLMDYRDVTPEQLGTFDHVCFFEMIESIWGPKNYLRFFQIIKSILKRDGNVFGQILGRNNPVNMKNDWIDRSHTNEPMIDKYIFKWWVLARIPSLIKASEQAGLFPRIIDNSLGKANGETCKAWNWNFQWNWKELRGSPDKFLWITKGEKYMRHFQDRFPYEINIDTFRRIWEYYLLGCHAWHSVWFINDGHYLWENNPENVSRPDIQIPQTRQEVMELLGK